MQTTFKITAILFLGYLIGWADFSAWNHSEKIFIKTGPEGINLNQYVKNPVILVRLDDSFFDFSQARPNGEDIRFADSSGTIPLPYEIERWAPEKGKAEIWVRLEYVYKNRDDQFITMFWGNTGAEDNSDPQNTFYSSHKWINVMHLTESAPGKGNLDVYKDATKHKRHGDDYMSEGETREMIGPAPRFNASEGDYIKIDNDNNDNIGDSRNFISFWFLSSANNEQKVTLISKDNKGMVDDSLRQGLNFNLLDNEFVNFSGHYDSSSGSIEPTIPMEHTFSTAINDGKWHYVAFSAGSRDLKFYLDGKLKAEKSWERGRWKNSGPFFIGAFQGNKNFFDGWIEEVRVVRDGKDPTWARFEYEVTRPDQKVIQFGEDKLQPPLITLQPQPLTLLTGEVLALSVGVNSSEPVTYQWYFNNEVLTGENSSDFVVSSASLSSAGKYFVVVSNSAGSINSDTVQVNVSLAPPKITSNPQSVPAKPGGTASFTVAAAGEGELNYQWLLNGEPISGAVNSTYIVSPAGFDMDGNKYSCRVSNAGGSVVSQEAVLSITINECEQTFTASAPDTIMESSMLVLDGFAECTQLFNWQQLSGPEWGVPNPSKMVDTIPVPRISQNRELTYRFSAKIGERWLYRDLQIVARNNLPDPQFTLTADSVWNPSSSLKASYSITNLTELQAAGVGDYTYRWFVSGLELDSVTGEGQITLSNPAGSGVLALGICLTNGGDEICESQDITVEPPTGTEVNSGKIYLPAIQVKNGEIIWNRAARIRILNVDGRTLLQTSGSAGARLPISNQIQNNLKLGRYQVLIEN